MPILAQLDNSSETEHADDESVAPPDDDYEVAGEVSWPRPAWGFVLFAIGVACWVFSPRGFLAGRFLTNVFLWAASVCFILGLIVLLGRWLVPDKDNADAPGE